MEARWAWSCNDPSALGSLGLQVVESAAVTRPPLSLQAGLPRAYRYVLPIAHRFIGDIAAVTLYRCLDRPGP